MSRPGPASRSFLAGSITRFLAAKRALGCRFENEERMLRLFDRYLVERRITRIDRLTGDCIRRFLASRQRPIARSYNVLLGTVRRLLEWMVSQDELATLPDMPRARQQTARRLPFLYEPATIRELLALAERLPDTNGYPQRGVTYATIFALIAGLGLRIGEASRLRCEDVDLEREVLLIRNTKFGKDRLVPFGPQLAKRLRDYLQLRERRLGPPLPDAPLFSWRESRPVHTNSIRNVFRDDLVPRLELRVPPGTARPCVHGLRHSFAVRSLLRWYRSGIDPAARLHHLSTFLGHVNPQATAVYLTITADLLQAANVRFERLAGPLHRGTQP